MVERGMTDIHCHVVYGIDDGPKTFEGSAEMLQAAYRDGVRTLIATSHTCPGITEFQTELYLTRLNELRAYCADAGLDLKLLQGAEILYSTQTPRFLREGRVLSLGESQYVLVEFLPDARYADIQDALSRILRSGYRPILAHVERYESLIASTKRMWQTKQQHEALFQMNCSTVLGAKSWRLNRQARRALEEGLIDLIASDAHNTTTRKTRMTEAYKYIATRYSEEEAQEMTGMTKQTEDNDNTTAATDV